MDIQHRAKVGCFSIPGLPSPFSTGVTEFQHRNACGLPTGPALEGLGQGRFLPRLASSHVQDSLMFLISHTSHVSLLGPPVSKQASACFQDLALYALAVLACFVVRVADSPLA